MSAAPTPWWRDAVIYQVYVRSFADTDGDGIGDLPGITLPPAATCATSASTRSGSRRSTPRRRPTAGYDVADYRDVDPLFGTLADFDALLADAHDAGPAGDRRHRAQPHLDRARVVPGGAGRGARQPGARALPLPRRAGAATATQPPNNWQSVFGGPAWTRRAPTASGTSTSSTPPQPDLNWRNPEVRDEFDDVLRFWLDRGVDGFRIDVAHGLVKEGLRDQRGAARPRAGPASGRATAMRAPGTTTRCGTARGPRRLPRLAPGPRRRTPATGWRVAEAWAPTPEAMARYVRPDELQPGLQLRLPARAVVGDRLRRRRSAEHARARSTLVGAAPTWVLSNHDVVRARDALRRRRRRARPRPGRDAAAARAARARRTSTRARSSGSRRSTCPPESRQDPLWLRTGQAARPRRLPGADPVVAATRAPYGFGPGRHRHRGCRSPTTGPALTVAAQRKDPRLDAGRSTATPCAPGDGVVDAGDEVELVDGRSTVLDVRRGDAHRRVQLRLATGAAARGRGRGRQRAARRRPAATGHRGLAHLTASSAV